MSRQDDRALIERILKESSNDEDIPMSENKVDVNGPWWEAGRIPPLDSYYSVSWANIGLTIQALHGGKPFFDRQCVGSLKEGDTLSEFTKRFGASFPKIRSLRVNLPSDSNKEKIFQYVNTDGAVSIEYDGDARIETTIITRDESFLTEALAFFKENTTESIPRGRVHVLISTSQGPEFKSMGVGGQKLERNNYENEVLAGYDRIIADLQAATPAGRVAILDGKPGTGKTFLVRGLLDEVKDVIFVIVPANLVQELAQPGMIPALVNLHQSRGNKPMVFLIEDADEVLAPRMGDNMSSVSAILNLGDGILGQLLDVRIIATTNAHHQDIDEAIKRPGRLSAMVHVDHLSPEKAGDVYKRLTGKPPYTFTLDKITGQLFKGKTSLAEVYQVARNDGWTPAPKERKMGFEVSEDETIHD